jgi:hypothetical protein
LKSQIDSIADHLIESFKDTLLTERKVKGDFFKLSFDEDSYTVILSCSLHHLDMPWEITSLIKQDELTIGSIQEIIKQGYQYAAGCYEITPSFLSNIENNGKALAQRIRTDFLKALALLKRD